MSTYSTDAATKGMVQTTKAHFHFCKGYFLIKASLASHVLARRSTMPHCRQSIIMLTHTLRERCKAREALCEAGDLVLQVLNLLHGINALTRSSITFIVFRLLTCAA